MGRGSLGCTLHCRAPRAGGRWLLLGERATLTDGEVLRAMARLHDEMGNLGRELARKNRELQQALDDVKRLQGVIPICMYCKQIRRDDQSWERLETYLSEHSEVVFSHGLCSDCERLHFPEDAEEARP